MSSSSMNKEIDGVSGGSAEQTNNDLVKGIGLLTGTAINMNCICGIGPFITIPLMVATIGGPQAIIGWIAGAILALADGLIWSELGAAMPGSGGTYIYLREAFQYRTGRLMPFIFSWTAILSIPLGMSSGVIGIVSYLNYIWPNMSWWEIDLLRLLIVGVLLFALYRRIDSIGLLSNIMFVIMLVTVGVVIVASFTHFNPTLAFTYPSTAFTFNGHFFAGMGAGLIIGMYDYGGYYTTSYVGAEIRNPGRVIPWSTIISVVAMMLIYLTLNIGVLGVLPWPQIAQSTSIASLVMNHVWGKDASVVVSLLVVVTAFASCFSGLLGGSRVPYHAARDGLFLSQFNKLHPRYHFPYVSLIVMCVITAIGTFLELSTLINVLTGVTVIVQSFGQIFALTVLRRRQPHLKRPYRMWLYPIPSVIALAGWAYAYLSSGSLSIYLSLIWVAAGIVVYLFWARFSEHTWPFGPKEIKEEYLEKQQLAEAVPA